MKDTEAFTDAFQRQDRKPLSVPGTGLELYRWVHLPSPEDGHILGTDELVEYFLHHADLLLVAALYFMQ